MLAPQWLSPNVGSHLRALVELEITRSQMEQRTSSDQRAAVGLQVPTLPFDRWAHVRDGLTDLWEWWADGVHLRPQIISADLIKPEMKPPYVQDLIRWTAPLSSDESEELELETSVSLDAHLGDGLCELCSLVHFFIAKHGGMNWYSSIEIEHILDRKYQKLGRVDGKSFILFSPDGRGYCGDDNIFVHLIARINAAVRRYGADSPMLAFLPGIYLGHVNLDGTSFNKANLSMAIFERATLSRVNFNGAVLSDANLDRANLDQSLLDNAQLDGASLYKTTLESASLNSANLSGARLNGAYLIGANLSGANLAGADLEGAAFINAILFGANLFSAKGLTFDQIKATYIDTSTKLPPEIEDNYKGELELMRAKGKMIYEEILQKIEGLYEDDAEQLA